MRDFNPLQHRKPLARRARALLLDLADELVLSICADLELTDDLTVGEANITC